MSHALPRQQAQSDAPRANAAADLLDLLLAELRNGTLWKRGRNSSLSAPDFKACLCTTARSSERVWLNCMERRETPLCPPGRVPRLGHCRRWSLNRLPPHRYLARIRKQTDPTAPPGRLALDSALAVAVPTESGTLEERQVLRARRLTGLDEAKLAPPPWLVNRACVGRAGRPSGPPRSRSRPRRRAGRDGLARDLHPCSSHRSVSVRESYDATLVIRAASSAHRASRSAFHSAPPT
jgi:hypothetical protein